MARIVWIASFLLIACLVMVGCTKQEDRLLREEIAAIEKAAEEFDKVTDKASFEQAQQKIAPLMEKATNVRKELEALPQNRKEAALSAHRAKLDAAFAKMAAAKQKAAKAAFGVP